MTAKSKRAICAKIDPRPYRRCLTNIPASCCAIRRSWKKIAPISRACARGGQSFHRRQVTDQDLVVSRDEGAVKLDQALVDSARLNLGYTDIVAPADGTVMARDVGAVSRSRRIRRRCFDRGDPKHVEVDAAPRASDVGAVRRGDAANVAVEGIPDRVFHGTVSQIRRSPENVQATAPQRRRQRRQCRSRSEAGVTARHDRRRSARRSAGVPGAAVHAFGRRGAGCA